MISSGSRRGAAAPAPAPTATGSSVSVFDYIVAGVHLVADAGWKLLPRYRFCPRAGEWMHRDHRHEPAMRLGDVSYAGGRMSYRSRHLTEPEDVLAGYLDEARRIFAEAGADAAARNIDDPPLSEDFQTLRWFPLPAEVQAELRRGG